MKSQNKKYSTYKSLKKKCWGFTYTLGNISKEGDNDLFLFESP